MRALQENISNMIKFSDILNRIMYLENTFVKTRIAELLGVNTALLATWEKRDTIPVKELLTYCEHSNVSIHWLFTGKGPRHIIEPAIDTDIEQLADPEAAYTTDYLTTLKQKADQYDAIIAALTPALHDIIETSLIKNGKNNEKYEK